MSKRSVRSAPTLGLNWVNAAGEQIVSFTSLDARLKRAHKHIDDLHAEIAMVFASTARANPDLMVVHNDDSKAGKRRIDVVNTVNTAVLSLIAGDAIHNLRSVLNSLYFNLARFYATIPPGQVDRIQFPAPKTAKIYKANVRGQIRKFRKDIANAFNRVYSDTKSRRTIWCLNNISNKDKHCALLGVAVKGKGWRALKRVSSPPITRMGDGGPEETIKAALALPFPLKQHTVIAGIPAADAGDDVHITFEIAINQPGILAGEPIIETLDYMFYLTDKIVRSFEPYFRP